VLLKDSGQYKNLKPILKSDFYRIILLYLLMNLISPILFYMRAKLFPIHALAPALNPITVNG
jgi:hypothetical protein